MAMEERRMTTQQPIGEHASTGQDGTALTDRDGTGPMGTQTSAWAPAPPADPGARQWDDSPTVEAPYGWAAAPAAPLPAPTGGHGVRARHWAPLVGAGILAAGLGGFALGAVTPNLPPLSAAAGLGTATQQVAADDTTSGQDDDEWSLPPQIQELLERLGVSGAPSTTTPQTPDTTTPQTAPDGSDPGTATPWGGGLGGRGGNGPGADSGQLWEGGSTTQESLSSTAQAAVAKITPAVVNVVTTVDYGTGQAAGTGIVLSADGKILTNHHVIEGATAIRATVVGTGQTYEATVLGSDATHDVALIQLQGASGLPVAELGDSDALQVGDLIVGVGNAGGDGGEPTSVEGQVTGLEQSITASDADGSSAQQLSGLIEVDANIQSGQSGGPLVNSAGQVVGMNTAAASTNGPGAYTATGYAIPIDDAVAIATAIARGEQSGTIRTGQTPFLGVQIASEAAATGQGVPIAGVVAASAAEQAGLGAGDTLVAVDGTAVTSAEQLTSLIQSHEVGDQLRVEWVGSDSANHSATVTLGAGPAA